jgi:hypothetical protein
MPLTSGEFKRLSVSGHDPFPSARSRLVEQYISRPIGGHGSMHYSAGTRQRASGGELTRLITQLRMLDSRWREMRSEVRLNHYEVRSWRGWHRHMTLAMVVQLAITLAKYAPEERMCAK